jgi:hypothetical protein
LRRRALWIVAALLAVDVAAGLVALTVLPTGERQPDPSAMPASSATARAASSPELSGYPVLNGNQGYPIAVGRPWGSPCAPIALVPAEGTPESVRSRLDEVVSEAAAGGVPVLRTGAPPTGGGPGPLDKGPGPLDEAPATGAEGPGPLGAEPGGQEVPVVQVAADTTSAPALPDGRPQQVLWYLQTELDPSGRSETIRAASTGLFVTAASTEVAQRRALRALLARSFGLAGSTASGSGLTAELGSTLDAFSPGDLAALRTMAGCG